MTSSEVLSMYETIAGLSAQMAAAAERGDFETLAELQTEVAIQSAVTASGVPALAGAPRQRKIDLIKQIMANDRAVREVTEPWKLENVLRQETATC